MAIVEENLGGRQQPPDAAVKAVQRWATWREPFVIWTATASRQGLSAWNYSIDAFTGQILRKDCPVHGMTMASAPGQTPCGPIGFEPPAGAASLMPTPEWLAACVAAQGGAKGSAPAAAVLGAGAVSTPKTGAVPDYSIQAIRYATVPRFPLSGLMMGAPEDQTVDIAMVVWLVRGGGHNVLFDTGFHRDKWMKEFTITDFLRPDEAVALAGVRPEEITDVVISHAHWDHMGGVDLFPKAQVWIQKQEYAYYSGDAWQPGGRHGGIDPEDVAALVQVNTEGRLHFVDGDGVEILPGIRAYTGARHTYASQYLRIDGATPYVLASDNCYLFSNLSEHVASATFDDGDRAANLKAQLRMIDLAGSPDRVIPGHDPRQFERFPTEGRVARIH
jgi:glyoxylase-like metal-dependent hydrolase (beta-lactamase superfamily II)